MIISPTDNGISFPPSFFLSVRLTDLVKSSREMLSRNTDREHPCLDPYFIRKTFHFSLLSMMVTLDLHVHTYVVKCVHRICRGPGQGAA